MDFVFGKLINDELKLTHHRASRSGIQHQHRITPADPTPTDNVRVHFVTSSDFPINGAALYIYDERQRPHWQPRRIGLRHGSKVPSCSNGMG